MPDNKDPLQEKYKLVLETINAYPLQLKQSWEEIRPIHVPDEYKNIDNIVYCGMGGSALGARIVKSYAFGTLRVPIEIVNGYTLPQYTGKNTLVFVSSYSGSTEETVESTYAALEKGSKIFGVTTGGKLSEILQKENLPGYIFNPIHNPSLQPRMAIGYSVGSILALFSKLGFLDTTDEEIEKSQVAMHIALSNFSESVPTEKNIAKNFAEKIKGRIPIFVASEHLVGAVHTIKNQFNESSKTFSAIFDIPELNHHLMEGLKNPAKLRELLTFVLVNSNLYSDKIKKRYPLTHDVIDKNNVKTFEFTPESNQKLSQVFETLIFGSYSSYYLTKIYGIDPMEIPWVDYFKLQLAK